jgi:hypothetical protein
MLQLSNIINHQELSPAVEEVLVKCLEQCGSFNYPLKKSDLQDLVQGYLLQEGIQSR